MLIVFNLMTAGYGNLRRQQEISKDLQFNLKILAFNLQRLYKV